MGNSWDAPVDEPVYVISDKIHFAEDVCRLPTPVDYSGTPMEATCDGESGLNTDKITLQSVGETLIFNDRITLYRCPQ